jgi:hypothetical protein
MKTKMSPSEKLESLGFTLCDNYTWSHLSMYLCVIANDDTELPIGRSASTLEQYVNEIADMWEFTCTDLHITSLQLCIDGECIASVENLDLQGKDAYDALSA